MPEINKAEMAASYGFALAFMNSSPELKSIFNQAVKQTWSSDRFIAELRNTKWFQKHSASVRNAIMQETSDPATYKAHVDQMASTVRDTWGSMFGSAGMNPKQLRTWAETAYRMGWSEAELVDRMTAGLNYRKLLQNKSLGGKAAEVEGQLNSLIENYAVDLGPKWKAAQLEKIMEGGDTATGVQERVKDLAMRQYKAFADRIAGGETVKEIADPYVQTMANLLEMNPNDVSFKAGLVSQALRAKTKDGKPAALDLNDFADMVRRDKRWQYTDNARKQVSDITENLLRSFGVVA